MGFFIKAHEPGISWVLMSDKQIRSTNVQRGMNMSIAEQVRQSQNTKDMTRRAIQVLEAAGENADDLKAEFFALYGESV